MKLEVGERLVLLSILPVEGDFTTLKIVRKLRESMSFSEEEHKALKLKQDGGVFTWEPRPESAKDIHIGEKAKDIIQGSLKKLNDEKKLRDEHFTLYERFVDGK